MGVGYAWRTRGRLVWWEVEQVEGYDAKTFDADRKTTMSFSPGGMTGNGTKGKDGVRVGNRSVWQAESNGDFVSIMSVDYLYNKFPIAVSCSRYA